MSGQTAGSADFLTGATILYFRMRMAASGLVLGTIDFVKSFAQDVDMNIKH